jgi:hypothetical protein
VEQYFIEQFVPIKTKLTDWMIPFRVVGGRFWFRLHALLDLKSSRFCRTASVAVVLLHLLTLWSVESQSIDGDIETSLVEVDFDDIWFARP